MNGLNSSMSLASSAMVTRSWGMAVAAHNVANINTDGFEPQRAEYATGPAGQRVRLSAILQGYETPGIYGKNTTIADAVIDVTTGRPIEALEPSKTDLAREMVNMISTQHAYEANAQVVRTSDDMLGTLLDIKA